MFESCENGEMKEIEVLNANEGEEVTNGIIKDEDKNGGASSGSGGETFKS
jgi:hypothetical protein